MSVPAEHQHLLDDAAQCLRAALEQVPWLEVRLMVGTRGRSVVPLDLEADCEPGYDPALLPHHMKRSLVLSSVERLARFRDLSGPEPWIVGALVLLRRGEETRVVSVFDRDATQLAKRLAEAVSRTKGS